jgi:hypothetical protein
VLPEIELRGAGIIHGQAAPVVEFQDADFAEELGCAAKLLREQFVGAGRA